MANASKKLEEKLLEFGRVIASLPCAVDELYSLLHKIDSHLSRVEQSPSPAMLAALQPLMQELVAKDLLRHSDMDVKAAVASCISEITRITAPEAPYDDDTMKEIFQMIVGTFETLDDLSSRSFQKRVSALETVAKVRSCVVMLDLECDELILEMFQHFMKTIRVYHSENVVASVETIMTLVIEESEDISAELLSCLLDTVKEDNKDVLPVARELVEKVMVSCSNKIKPYLVELVESSGASLSGYSKVVASICEESSTAVDQNGSGKVLADESKLSERTISDEHPQVSAKLEQDGGHENIDAAEATSPMAATSNGTVQVGNGDSMEQPSSPKQKSERSQCNGQSKNPVTEHVDADNLDTSALKRTKGRKANSLVQLTDTTDHSRIDSNKDTPAVTSRRRGRKKEVGSSHADDAAAKDAETSVLFEPEERNDLEHVPGSDIRTSVALPTPAESPVGLVKRKRGRPPSQKAAAKRRDVNSVSDKAASLSGEKDSCTETDVIKDSDLNKEPKNADDGSAPAIVMSDSEINPLSNSVKRRGLKRKDVEQESSERRQKSSRKQADTPPRKDVTGEPSLKKELDESLVGSKIKVWWPDDRKFYTGVVDSFDPKKKKHKILYADGDVEKLVLWNKRWKVVESGTEKEEVTLKDEGTASQTIESSSKEGGRPRGGPTTGASSLGKVSNDDSVRMSRKTKGKAASEAGIDAPKSSCKYRVGSESQSDDVSLTMRSREEPKSSCRNRDGSESQSDDVSLKTRSREDKPGNGKSLDEVDTSNTTAKSKKDTSKSSVKSEDEPPKKRGRKPKGTQNKYRVGSESQSDDVSLTMRSREEPKSSCRNRDGSESQSDDVSLKTRSREDKPGNGKSLDEVDTSNTTAKSKKDTSKSSVKSEDEPPKKRGRKPKGTQNASSTVKDETSESSSKPVSDTGKSKVPTSPKAGSSKSDGGELVGKNQYPRINPEASDSTRVSDSTPKTNDSKVNSIASEGKAKLKEDMSTPEVDDGEATKVGTGGRKPRRKGSHK